MKNNKKSKSYFNNLKKISSDFSSIIKTSFQSYAMIIVLLAIWTIFAIATKGAFLIPRNLSNLFRQMTILGCMSIGMIFVITAGNIDLALGVTTGFASVFSVGLQTVVFTPNMPIWFPSLNEYITIFGMQTTINGVLSTLFSCIVCIIFGIMFGAYQGFLIGYLGIPSFIGTFGNALILGSLVGFATLGSALAITEKSFVFLGQGYASKEFGVIIAVIVVIAIFLFTLWNRRQKKNYGVKLSYLSVDILKALSFSLAAIFYIIYIANGYLGFQIPVLIMMIAVLIFSYVLSNTRFGRYCFAIGGSKETARFSGVNVRRNIMNTFIISGLMGSIAGIISAGYMGGANFGEGMDLTFPAMIVCIIGLISFKDRERIIIDVLIGALIIESIDNFMVFLDAQPHIKYIIKGFILLIVVYIAKMKKINIESFMSSSIPTLPFREIINRLVSKIKNFFGDNNITIDESAGKIPSKFKNPKLIWGLIIIFAFIFLVAGISHESLWCDEAFSANMTDYSFIEILKTTVMDVHPPLYYLLLKVVKIILGNSVWALRITSIMGAFGMILLAPGAVRRLFGNRTAFIYAIVAIFTPIILIMAHELRMYSFAMFTVMASALYGLLAVTENKKRDWILFGISVLTSAYLHYYGLISVFFINLFLLMWIIIKKRELLKSFIITASIVVLSYLPWVFFFIRQIKKVDNDFWISPVEPITVLFSFLQPFYYKNFFPISLAVLILAILVLVLVISTIIAVVIMAFKEHKPKLVMGLFLFSIYMSTLISTIIISYILRPIFYPRYMVVCTGLLILPFCIGISYLKNKNLRYLVIILFIFLNLKTISNVITKEFNGSFSKIKERLDSSIKPGDLIITSDCYCISPSIYYFPKADHFFYVNSVEKNWDFTFDAMRPHLIKESNVSEVLKKYKSFWVITSKYVGNLGLSADTAEILKDSPGWEEVTGPIKFYYPYSLAKFSVSRYEYTGKINADEKIGKIVIKIKNIKNPTGKLWVGLYTGNPVGDLREAYKVAMISINTKEEVEHVFYNVKYGEYAVFIMHDMNNNQRFELSSGDKTRDGLGIYNYNPKYGLFPTFDQLKFEFNEHEKQIEVKISYF